MNPLGGAVKGGVKESGHGGRPQGDSGVGRQRRLAWSGGGDLDAARGGGGRRALVGVTHAARPQAPWLRWKLKSGRGSGSVRS